MFQIVTNNTILSEIKKCKYFTTKLGYSSTMDNIKGDREYSKKDEFAYSYNNYYKTTIYMCGNIGDITFYNDYYIKEDILAVYINLEEFIIPFDRKVLREKSIDIYLGSILQKVESDYESKSDNKNVESINVSEPKGDFSKLTKNPGMITYDDIKDYVSQKNKNRI